jgi:hypothetical protein
VPPRSKPKRAAQPKAPPLDWLRQSVWAGEELPDELALLEAMEPAQKPKPKQKATSRSRPKPARKK